MSDLDLHDLPPPPPAYSEEDFDKKVSTAVELSLNTPQPHHDEAWETWDDEAFKAAASQALASSKPYSPIEKILPRTQGGSSHLNPTALPYQPIRPLKINKRTVDPNPSKPPPNWFENQESINPRQAPSVSHDVAGLRYSSRQLPSPDDPSAPSLDGPPYEQVVRSSWPGSRSRGPSPHHHVPRLPQTQQHYTQRHSQYPSHRLTSPTSISMFDPSIAYHQESNIITPQPEQEQEEQEEQHIPDAACLYKLVLVLFFHLM
ncbi:hypothetical protein F5887DRAFT_937446 [Amanita rubescens]|nr:hypothetical protein F5887DRAFT_937446 [Amanita rubescens]